MLKQIKISWAYLSLLFALVLVSSISGCAVKFIADYDASTFEETLKVGKKVDRFYGNLLEVPENARSYSKHVEQYVEIETDIRSLVTRNQARPLNEESTIISKTILKLWIKYKQNHEKNDKYINGTAKLDRARFVRLFNAAAAAEEAKKLDAADRDAEKESKEAE